MQSLTRIPWNMRAPFHFKRTKEFRFPLTALPMTVLITNISSGDESKKDRDISCVILEMVKMVEEQLEAAKDQ